MKRYTDEEHITMIKFLATDPPGHHIQIWAAFHKLHPKRTPTALQHHYNAHKFFFDAQVLKLRAGRRITGTLPTSWPEDNYPGKVKHEGGGYDELDTDIVVLENYALPSKAAPETATIASSNAVSLVEGSNPKPKRPPVTEEERRMLTRFLASTTGDSLNMEEFAKACPSRSARRWQRYLERHRGTLDAPSSPQGPPRVEEPPIAVINSKEMPEGDKAIPSPRISDHGPHSKPAVFMTSSNLDNDVIILDGPPRQHQNGSPHVAAPAAEHGIVPMIPISLVKLENVLNHSSLSRGTKRGPEDDALPSPLPAKRPAVEIIRQNMATSTRDRTPQLAQARSPKKLARPFKLGRPSARSAQSLFTTKDGVDIVEFLACNTPEDFLLGWRDFTETHPAHSPEDWLAYYYQKRDFFHTAALELQQIPNQI